MKISFLIIFLVAQCCGNQQITVVGPRTITNSSIYKAYVDVSELLRHETLILALKSQDKVHHVLKFDSASDLSGEVEFKLPKNLENSYTLMSLLVSQKANNKKICRVKKSKIFTATSKNIMNLIQTDKPVYKPGENVRFRVLTLDHETKPYKYNSINVDVIDSNGNVFKTFNDFQKSDFGFYENSLTLFDDSAFGNWRLEVQIDQSNVKSSKTFAVKDFKPPPFQLYIETPPRVAYDGYNPSITLKIYAKYPFDKFVKGSAMIYAKVFNKNSPDVVLSEKSRKVQIEGGSENIKFDLRNDLNINFLTKPAIVEFSVEFTETQGGRKAEQSQRVEILPQGNHFIKLTKPDNFKPGFSYKINADVFTLDGKPEKSTSLPLTMRIKYNYKNNTSIDISQPQFLKNGKSNFVLNPPIDVSNFLVIFEFERAKVEDFIESKKQANAETLQVTFKPESPKIGDTIKISAESNSLMNTLKVLVISRNGFIKSQTHEDSEENFQYNFELEVTPEMAPEATVIVFYTRDQDGEIIYDQFKLELGFKNTNQLKIQLKADTYKPKETASFTLTTEPRSFVGLLGIDESVRYLGSHNDITQEDVDSKVSSLGKLKSEKYEGKLYLDLAKSNVFVLQPLKSTKHFCKPSEEKYIETGFVGRLEVIQTDDEVEEFPEWDDIEALEAFNAEDELIRKYFPDVWIFDSFDMQRPTTTFSQVVPDTITSWMLSGFSIHPEHGLAIAEPQKIKVYQDFFIKVGVPSSVKIGEVFKIDVTVHNYLDDEKNVDITLQRDEFELLDERQRPGGAAGCMDYYRGAQYQKRVLANAQSGASTEFLTRALKSGNINIKIVAVGDGVQDSVEKTVKVDYEGATHYKSFPMLIDLRRAQMFDQNVLIDVPKIAEPNTIKIEASLSGNLLGPAMENIDHLITMPEGCGEQKMKALAISIYAYKYLKSLNLANATLTENAKNSMQKGYQDARALQTLSGAFKLWNKKDSSEGIWLTAYISQLLGDAREFIDIDDQFYYRSLEYFKTKQRSGLFEDDSNNPRLVQGSPQYRKIYLTAFVMIAIAKNKKTYDDFAYINNEAVDYLSRIQLPYDYEKAIVAYAFALSGEREKAEDYFNSLGWNFLTANPVKALQVEIASYVILAAIQLERFDDAKRAVDWLIKQRRPHGGFLSTHDTVLGLQALAAMQEYLGTQNPAMNVKFNPGRSEKIESLTDSKFVELSPSARQFTVTASGSGLAYVNVFYQYKTKSALTNAFTIQLDDVAETNDGININFKVGSRATTNMAIVEVEIPSGFEYSSGKFSDDVQKIEFNDDKTRVFLYFNLIKADSIKNLQSIEATKVVDVKEPKLSTITVYDYYEPEISRTNLLYDVKKELKCNVPNQRPQVLAPAATPSAYHPQKPAVIPTQRPPLDSRFYNHVNEIDVDRYPDVRWTAVVLREFNDGTLKFVCTVAMVTDRIAIGSTSCGIDADIYSLRVRTLEPFNNKLEVYDHKILKVQAIQSLLAIHLITPVSAVISAEIPSLYADFTNHQCIASGLDANDNFIKQKIFILSPHECHSRISRPDLICSDDKFNIKGHPLVCRIGDRFYLAGIYLQESANGSIYYPVKTLSDLINQHIANN